MARWALPWMALIALVALVALSAAHAWAATLTTLSITGTLVGATGWLLAARGIDVPWPVAILSYGLMGNVAAMRAFMAFLGGGHQAVWEPTQRGAKT